MFLAWEVSPRYLQIVSRYEHSRKHTIEKAQLVDHIQRLENLARGNAADHLLSGVHPGFHIPTNRRNIVRLPNGPDFCSIYYDDESDRLVVDLIEGNFASDPVEVSFTELQRKMKRCVSTAKGWLQSVGWSTLKHLRIPTGMVFGKSKNLVAESAKRTNVEKQSSTREADVKHIR